MASPTVSPCASSSTAPTSTYSGVDPSERSFSASGDTSVRVGNFVTSLAAAAPATAAASYSCSRFTCYAAAAHLPEEEETPYPARAAAPFSQSQSIQRSRTDSEDSISSTEKAHRKAIEKVVGLALLLIGVMAGIGALYGQYINLDMGLVQGAALLGLSSLGAALIAPCLSVMAAALGSRISKSYDDSAQVVCQTFLTISVFFASLAFFSVVSPSLGFQATSFSETFIVGGISVGITVGLIALAELARKVTGYGDDEGDSHGTGVRRRPSSDSMGEDHPPRAFGGGGPYASTAIYADDGGIDAAKRRLAHIEKVNVDAYAKYNFTDYRYSLSSLARNLAQLRVALYEGRQENYLYFVNEAEKVITPSLKLINPATVSEVTNDAHRKNIQYAYTAAFSALLQIENIRSEIEDICEIIQSIKYNTGSLMRAKPPSEIERDRAPSPRSFRVGGATRSPLPHFLTGASDSHHEQDEAGSIPSSPTSEVADDHSEGEGEIDDPQDDRETEEI